MKKPFTFLRLIPIFALFFVPSLLLANGEPNNTPLNKTPDSLAMLLGHCNPITVVTVNCVTKTIELSAFIYWTFTGQQDPYVTTWSTGEVAHKITVVPPGTWSWDASGTGCEQNHWQNEYSQPGSFFQGGLDILGQTLCPNGFIDLTVVPPDNIYSFVTANWNPVNPNGTLSFYDVYEPGTYQLTVTDQLGCSFTDQINVPQSPPVVPTLSGPLSMSPVGDTAVLTVNQVWSAYLWSTGHTTNSITVTEPGIYEVTVTNQFGCTGVGSIGIQQQIPLPWTVTPTSRNHTIIIPDTLKTDLLGGDLQIGDQIGVFYDSSGTLICGGYAVWSGLPLVFAAYGNDAAPLPKNGFNTGEVFKIKYWRAATGQVFDASVQYAPVGWLAGLITHTNAFADDGISMIKDLTTKATHAVALNNGWNMISSYVVPAHPDMKDVFAPIASSVDIVKDGAGDSYIPLLMINGIGNWNLLKGYQVKANQKDTLLVTGQKAVPEANPMLLKTGWQIIGYLRESPMNIDTVFKSIKTQINLVKNNDGKIYSPQFGINTIGNMIPGQGYKVNALSNVTLSYRPNFTGSPVAGRAESAGEYEMPHFVLDSNLNTGNNAILILMDSIADNVIDSGDEIGVFTSSGTLCGTAKYKQGENLAITVWGDDPSTPAFVEGLKVDSAYNFVVWDSSDQKECMAITSFQSGINAYAPDAIELIQTLMLGVPTYATITAVACNSYVLNNQAYTSSGIYTQILTNAAGCDSTITLHLTINPVPNITVDAQTICSGQTATLTANGAENYLWSTGATSNSITVSPNATTIYTVTGTTADCTASVESTVTVHPLPVIDLGANISLSAGDTAVLDATCACQSYQWSTGETTSTIRVHSMGIYTVTVYTDAGCTASDDIVIMTTSTYDPHDGYSISISPNPTEDLLFITCSGASTSSVQIIDNLGKLILKENTFVSDGTLRTISLKKIPSGSYYVRIVGDGFAKTIPIIKH